MAKGLFTQGIVVLLRQSVSIEEVAAAIDDFHPSDPIEASEDWTFLGPAVLMNMDEDGSGKVVVDVVDHPWPDAMGGTQGDSAASEDSQIVDAWALGNFGPHNYPGSLQRAREQSWVWEDGRELAEQPTAFIRVRSSYVLGEEDDAPVLPEGYEPFDELALVTEIAAAITELPQAICYFNPNGEVLRDLKTLNESFEYAEENDFPPLDLWSNVRLFRLENEWAVMDTVGNSQLDLLDIEACFHAESYDFTEVESFLRLVTCFLEEAEEPIEDGDSVEGPGDVIWRVWRMDDGIAAPPRPVLRCLPQDNRDVPEQYRVPGMEQPSDEPEPAS
ncbi:DUF4261 domain-containing protein [Allorhodopirellula heiligendammensis]|uniref:DUF4261 domain-containing protein n=1 Tax=Allorhodopirellula heiligendammensis TaxID=2714739 RepID=A0A5C6C3G2_9BACT|nr:DUF4261 domain-containing protein [Allorhodopirellula heiligendammensis]TWU18151.1 hypothetical protein Poly21_03060 [Allorhodopirellula heiligendammensis]|tara:strand:+ start:642 stop:1634 length:993 start_codon:yes stop_codon:yes gene_type:complete